MSHLLGREGDGLTDMVCQVETEQLILEAGDTMAMLEGWLIEGMPIHGEDSVRIVQD